MSTSHKLIAPIIAAAVVAGCAPAPYSFDFSGAVVDDGGKPIQGASVVSVVYKSCGSLGGKTSERLKSSVVKTGIDGRYHSRIAGVSILHFEGIAACLGYEHHTVACKAGFKPSPATKESGNQVLRLSPGVGWTHIDLPSECAAGRVITEAQARLPELPRMPPPTKGEVEIGLWDNEKLRVKYQDPAEDQSPSTSIEPIPIKDGYWLVVREHFTGGRPDRQAHIYRGKGYATVTGFNGIDSTNIYVFLLKPAEPNSPVFESTQRVEIPTTTVHLEPAGGVRWTVKASGPNRIGDRISPVSITKDDWLPLQDTIAEMNGRAMAKGIILHVPKDLKHPPAPSASGSGKGYVIQPTGQRMSIPLWGREWMYPTVLDRGGAGAPYPTMPVISIEGPQYRLVAVEHTGKGIPRETEVSIVSGEFFFTKDYSSKDGRYRTYIFELGKPEPTAGQMTPTAAAWGEPARLQPRGGIAWDITIENRVRKGSPLQLRYATPQDWKNLRADIAAFARREENRQIALFDPSPQPVRKAIPTWVPGLEVFPEVYDPGAPGLPLVKIPYYHRMGWSWITVEEIITGNERRITTAHSREWEYTYEHKPSPITGTVTIYVFPTWLARPGSSPLIEFPDKPVQFNEGGMVFSRAMSYEPLGGMSWTIKLRNGVRTGGQLTISPVDRDAWDRFRPQIVSLNKDLNRERQQYLQVLFDPNASVKGAR